MVTMTRNRLDFLGVDQFTYQQLADALDSLVDRQVERVEWSLPALKDDSSTSRR